MTEKKWVLLKHKGIEYYGFRISEDGEVQNKNTGNILTSFVEGKCEYVIINFNGYAKRINLAIAQLDSGLEVTKLGLNKNVKRVTEPTIRELLNSILERLDKLEGR